MSGKKINFIVQSHMWKHPETDAQKNQNVYPVARKFLYKKDELKNFEFIKIGKNKEKDIKNLRFSNDYIFSIPEEQIKVEEWTQSGKTYNALSLGNDVVIDELKGKKDITFSYKSCETPSSSNNYLTFKGWMIGIEIETVGEKWVFPIVKEIIISFPNREEREKKYWEFYNKKKCVVEGVDWERARIHVGNLEIDAFSKIGETFTETGKTTPTPEKPETTTETHTTETEETGGDTLELETTGTPEQNATPSPETVTEETGDSEANNNNSSTEEPNNGSNSANSNNQALKKQVISVIKTALISSEPKLTNSDLGPEYQNWETKLNGFSEENEINSWKDKVLAHIQAQKKVKQTSQKVDDDFKKTQDQNATVQDKKEALDELDKNEGHKAYEEKKEQIKEIKKEVAKDNPNEYRNKLISILDKKLAENGLNESDLDDQTRQERRELKNGNDLEPDKLVELEIKLTEKIGQAGSKKKIDNFAVEVEKVLKIKEKVRVEKLKKELLEILNSSNVYYSAHKSRAEQLLKQLENISTTNNSNLKTHDTLPLPVKIGIGFLFVLVVGFFSFLIWKGKRTDDHPWKYRIRRG